MELVSYFFGGFEYSSAFQGRQRLPNYGRIATQASNPKNALTWNQDSVTLKAFCKSETDDLAGPALETLSTQVVELTEK